MLRYAMVKFHTTPLSD